MLVPTAEYGGRGRVKGSAWQSPKQIKDEQEKKEQQDLAKATPFEEFKSADNKYTIFRQTPYTESTHQRAFCYIELYENKIENAIIYFFKEATCSEFCDMVRRQLLNGVFRSYDLELFLADDDGHFDDKNEPPPSNEKLAKIINIGLDSFYFKITNSWQLTAPERASLVKQIIGHKSKLHVLNGVLDTAQNEKMADSDDTDESDDANGDTEQPLDGGNVEQQILKESAVDQRASLVQKDSKDVPNRPRACCHIL